MNDRLNQFFEYHANFNLLDETLKTPKSINKFHSANVEYFNNKVDFSKDENSIDWHFRSFRSLRQIFHSSLMYTESKVTEKQYCIASVFFSKYYAFLHAVKSVLYITPMEKFSPRLGHSQSINMFMSNYCQGKRKVFDKGEFESFAKTLRDLREITSYQIPHSGSNFLNEDDFKNIENQLSHYLLKLYQLSHYLSFIVSKKHISVPVVSNYELFHSYEIKYFRTPHPFKSDHIDYSDDVFINDTIRANATYCEPFCIIFEHEMDEFQIYSGFEYLEHDESTFVPQDVTSFIWKAL
ncbi:hypothetical protein Q4601_17870 [Shewanella sp. 1_MG-2023]|uniref:hypothetical protein n=1 Tax=unclassified Shewanella TaxID=196818 RepID=UPI0026E3EDB8|nr:MULTISPECIES: hypothetical protein [unclassified Shewanella]MDO6613941.1 hypothetical protein [Shewanella sp. 7_MG-2023]MDO6773271.1 hypothetical protein [Shewanella sp. 2_MG-2023]MDO6796165.1 hypothetical protein [Shewanella sp. 1_MG-2023]